MFPISIWKWMTKFKKYLAESYGYRSWKLSTSTLNVLKKHGDNNSQKSYQNTQPLMDAGWRQDIRFVFAEEQVLCSGDGLNLRSTGAVVGSGGSRHLLDY